MIMFRAKTIALNVLWQGRAIGYRCYWFVRSLPFSVYFGLKAILIKRFWQGREMGYRCYWFMRSMPFSAYFGLKAILIKRFWQGRAIGYRCYWFVRSLPFKLQFLVRNLFYRYLFQYRSIKILRAVLALLGNHYYTFRVKLLHGLKGRSYILLPMSQFDAQYALKSILIEPRSSRLISGPQFLGSYSFKPIGEPKVQLNMPELEIYPLKNAAVIGGTNFICIDNRIVYPDVFLPERDVCPAELNGIAKINLASKMISLFSIANNTLKNGVSLLGSCTGNYAHWLTETLPKLLVVDSVREGGLSTTS